MVKCILLHAEKKVLIQLEIPDLIVLKNCLFYLRYIYIFEIYFILWRKIKGTVTKN